MTPTQSIQPQAGILVATTITAGIGVGFGEREQHAEGIVVSTAIRAGLDGSNLNHAEGIAVTTAITAGGRELNHAEGIVLR